MLWPVDNDLPSRPFDDFALSRTFAFSQFPAGVCLRHRLEEFGCL